MQTFTLVQADAAALQVLQSDDRLRPALEALLRFFERFDGTAGIAGKIRAILENDRNYELIRAIADWLAGTLTITAEAAQICFHSHDMLATGDTIVAAGRLADLIEWGPFVFELIALLRQLAPLFGG